MTLPGDTLLPQKGAPQESFHLALAAKLNKFPSLPREMTKHTPENTTLASNWTEMKVLHERPQGIRLRLWKMYKFII